MHNVRTRRAHHAYANGWQPVEPRERALVGETIFDGPEVADGHDLTLRVHRRQISKLLRRAGLAHRADVGFAALAIEVTGGEFDVLIAYHLEGIERIHLAGTELFAVEPNPHRSLAKPAEHHAAATGHGLDVLFQRGIDELVQFAERLVAVNAEPDDRELVEVQL